MAWKCLLHFLSLQRWALTELAWLKLILLDRLDSGLDSNGSRTSYLCFDGEKKTKSFQWYWRIEEMSAKFTSCLLLIFEAWPQQIQWLKPTHHITSTLLDPILSWQKNSRCTFFWTQSNWSKNHLSHKPTQANSLFLCALVAPRTWEATDGISAVSPRESVAVAVEPAQLTGLVRTIYNNEI